MKTMGVYFCKERKKFVAQISSKNKSISLGRFDTLEQAKEARRKGEELYFKDIKVRIMSKSQIKEVLKLAETMNISEICRLTGRAWNTVKKLVNDNFKRFDYNKWNPTEEEWAQLKSGKSIKELVVLMKRSGPTLRRYMRENGIPCPFRIKAPPKVLGPKIPRLFVTKILKMKPVKPTPPSVPRCDGENRILEAMKRLGLK